MSSTRLLALPLLLAAIASAAPPRRPVAPALTCPAQRDGAALTAASLFDGPIEERADLVPDSDRTVGGAEVSTWNVAGVYAAGRQVYASCRYADRDVIVPVTHPVKACRYTVAKRSRTLSCR